MLCLARQVLADPLPLYDIGSSGCGCSSGVEHNLAKVGVVGSNPIARSSFIGRGSAARSSEATMPRWPINLLLKLFAEPRIAIGGAAATAEAFLPACPDAPAIFVAHGSAR